MVRSLLAGGVSLLPVPPRDIAGPQYSSAHVHAMCYLTARSATLAVEGQMMRNFIRCKPDLWSEDIGEL